MAKTNIMSVWEKLLAEGAEASKNDASKFINECAAGILSDMMNEEEPPVISIEDEDVVPTADQSVVTVYYEDPDGTCDYDDDIIAASNKDDIDGGGWGKGLRVINFIYDSSEDAIQASNQISDIEDVPGLSTSVATPDDVAASDDVDGLPEIEDETVEVEESVSDFEKGDTLKVDGRAAKIKEEPTEDRDTYVVEFIDDGTTTEVPASEAVIYDEDGLDEGKDEGKPGKNFKKIEDKAAKEYGSTEAGEKVAGAVLSKLRKEHPEEYTESKRPKKKVRSFFAPVDTDVSESEETENDKVIVKFPSDGDENVVDEFKDFGFDIAETFVDDEGNRVIVIDAISGLPDDLAVSAQDVLKGMGVSKYTIDIEEDEKVEEDVTTDENGDVTTDETPEETLDALQADLDALRLELEDAGIVTDNGDDSDEDISLASLEESFLGYEEVKGNQPSELNSKTGFGSDDGKSPIISKPVKDRSPAGEPIEVKNPVSDDDGTHIKTPPATKELPATKNNIKSLKTQYKKVGKESGSKLNSKEGFGEDGKKSVVD